MAAADFFEVRRAAVRGIAPEFYEEGVIRKWAAPVSNEKLQSFRENIRKEVRLVAERDGKVVDVAVLHPGQGQILACYVLPGFAGAGVGAVLLRSLEEIARQRGLTKLTLDASLNARAFYERHGYRSLGEAVHRMESGLEMPCIAMEKSL